MIKYSSEIEKLRFELNQIDHDIVSLLEKRFKITDEVGNIKSKLEMPIFQPDREREILQRILEQIENPEFESEILGVYEEIMRQSKKQQIR